VGAAERARGLGGARRAARHTCGMPADIDASPLVACLCAAWCGSCRDYRPLFEQLESAFPAARFAWVDIEDHAELVGDLDVENFPTLLIAVSGEVVFLGPVTPHLQTAERLLRSALDGAFEPVDEPDADALAARIGRWASDSSAP
jgi:thioredoxin 1